MFISRRVFSYSGTAARMVRLLDKRHRCRLMCTRKRIKLRVQLALRDHNGLGRALPHPSNHSNRQCSTEVVPVALLPTHGLVGLLRSILPRNRRTPMHLSVASPFAAVKLPRCNSDLLVRDRSSRP